MDHLVISIQPNTQIMIQLLLAIIIILWIVYTNLISRRHKLNLPPGSFGWPILGESLSLLRAGLDGVPERFDQERVEKHGSPLVFKTSLFGNRMAVLCGPAGNKFLFGNENKLVAAWWPYHLRKLFGKCLFTSHGDEAKWLKKMMLSYLGPDTFANHYVATLDVVARRHIELYWRGKEEVKVHQTIELYAFEVVCRLFMSLEEPNHIAKLGSLFNIFLKGIIGIPIYFPGTQFYSSIKAAIAIRTELMKIIKARRVDLAEGKASSTQDLLSHLLTSSGENGRYLTEMEITNNILMLLVAGYEPSTLTTTLLVKRLGEHHNVYEKVLKAVSLPPVQDSSAAKERIISFWSLDAETRTFPSKAKDFQELSSQSHTMSSAGKSTRSGSKFNVMDLQEYASAHSIKKELASTPKPSNPKTVTTMGKGAKKRKADEPTDALAGIHRQVEELIAEKFTEIQAIFDTRIEEVEQFKLDLQKIALVKDKKLASLDKEISMLQKEAVLTHIQTQKEMSEIIEEAKHSAAVAMLEIKVQMAKEAADPAFDRSAWEVDAWEERLAELKKDGMAEEGEGAGGSGLKDPAGADEGKDPEKAVVV